MLRTLYTGLFATLLLLAAASVHAQDPLKPELAYKYAAVDAGGTIEVDWAIEDGYYLYKKKLSFESGSGNVILGDYQLPRGLDHEDEFFGKQEIYRDRFYVSIPYTVVGDAPESIDLTIKSQGCADIGICYPPQAWSTDVELLQTSALAAPAQQKPTLGGGAFGDFLPPDQVFKPYVMPVDGNTVEISFQVAPGYYLYKDKITATAMSERVQLGQPDLPKGKEKFDEYFGEQEVYYEDVFAKVPLARATPDAMELDVEINYQGCADGGLCYPPITRTLTVSLPEAIAVSELAVAGGSGASGPGAPGGMVSEQDRLASLITGSSLWLVIATFFGAGLLLAFTPCVLPMVPILSGIIAGDGDDVSSSRGFLLALSYVMGMALIYTGAGIIAAAVGVQLQAVFNAPWVLTVFAGLFVLLALGMFGLFEIQMPSAIQTRISAVSGKQKSGTFVGAFVMGALSSLIVTACVAPPLVATLTVIGQTGDMVRGGSALFAMSLGMGAPLLLVGASAGKLLPKAGAWMVAIKNAFGFMMLGLAIWMLSRILPGEITLALWAVLIFMAGVFLGGLTNLTPESSGSQKLGKGFGLLAVLYGGVLLIGSLAGSDSLLRPLGGLTAGSGGVAAVQEQHGLDFQRVKTVDDLDAAIASAATNGKTVMLDFYADWCVSCIEMEEFTFTDSAVQAALSNTVLLQADVTANDEADQALLARFGVFGPPTIIFFDTNGEQRHGYEVVGYMKAAAFTDHVLKATAQSGTITAQSANK